MLLPKPRLEAIIHRLVHSEMQRQAQAAEADGAHCDVFGMPLLVASRRWRALVDRTLVFDCSEQTQVKVVMRQDGLTPVEIQRI